MADPVHTVDVEICLTPTTTARPADVRERAIAALEAAHRGPPLRPYAPGPVTALLRGSGDALLARAVKSARICELYDAEALALAGAGAGAAAGGGARGGPRRRVALPSVSFWAARLRVFVYQASEDGPSSEAAAPAGEEGGGGGGGDGDVLSQYTQWSLPAAEFDGTWESLLYEDDDEEEEGGGEGGEGGDGGAAGSRGGNGGGGGGARAARFASAAPSDSEATFIVDVGASVSAPGGGGGAKRSRGGGGGGGGGGGSVAAPFPAGAASARRAPSSPPASAAGDALSGSRLKPSLLAYATSSLLFADAGVDGGLIAANHVVLLHGPPGTGKTSLCKALAHKLAIRFGARFPSAQLIEINAHSLFSRWFSESGKLVHRLFGHIRELCDEEDCLVVLLIDEVESLTSARKAAVSGSEPSDAVRVVNAVLTAIDSFRARKNVLLLTTSNVSEAIDVAFVDRADVKARVGPPGARARYDILASTVAELARVGIVRFGAGGGEGGAGGGRLADATTAKALAAAGAGGAGGGAGGAGVDAGAAGAGAGIDAGAADDMAVDTSNPSSLAGVGAGAGAGAGAAAAAGVDAAASALVWAAAVRAAGFSGRTLRKLPLTAHAMFVRPSLASPPAPASGVDFGIALGRAVDAERRARVGFADMEA